MASLMNRLTQFANSPRGRQAIRQLTERGQQLARDPRTRARIEEVRRRFQGGGAAGGGTTRTGRRP
jgi:hypothetical protein